MKLGNVKVFMPESRVVMRWNIVMTVFILLSSLVFPYRIISDDDPLDWFYWLVTIVFFIDIFFEFNTVRREGFCNITSRKEIAHKYLSSWFIPDLLSAIPFFALTLLFENMVNLVGVSAFFLAIFRIMKLLKLFRLFKLFKGRLVFKYLQEALDVNPAIMRLIVFAFWFLLVTHFMSIGWLAIDADPGSQLDDFRLRYLQALYWCITTIATVGYGDIAPDINNPLHLIYTIMVQLIGVGMYVFVIGNMASLIANIDITRAKFKQKMEEIREYMKVRNFPEELQQKVKDYYFYLWETQRIGGSRDFLKELPHTLYTDILIFKNRELLEKVSLFKDADEIFLRELVRILETIIFLPGDYIIRQGEFGDCMYFISIGDLEVMVNGKFITNLEAGSPFGEAALLGGNVRNATVRAITFCETYRLTKKDFDALREKYPEFDQKVNRIMKERSEKNR